MQYPLDSIHPQARKAGQAALCAGKEGAKAFWAMHDRLFANTSEWSGKENAVDVFKGYASALGLKVDAFNSCLDSGEMDAAIDAQAQEGLSRGVSGVPAFYVNDWFISGAQPFSVFQTTIEKALSGQHPPPTPTPLPEGKTWTDPNPERPGYTYGGDAYLGSETAEVLLFEFTNFGSAENRTVALETLPELRTKYVDSGKVRLLVKHLAVAEQPATVQAAEAAECAGRQQAFWKMYDLLWKTQDRWKGWQRNRDFNALAREIGLDEQAFERAMAGDQAMAQVKADLDEGANLGKNLPNIKPEAVDFIKVNGTPVIFADNRRVWRPHLNDALWYKIITTLVRPSTIPATQPFPAATGPATADEPEASPAGQ